MKQKYEKPFARDLNNLAQAQGKCESGSVAQTLGFANCKPGALTDGGYCGDGTVVAGCIQGAMVTNYCATGGTVNG
jgi:hypothetical protein